MHLKNNVVIKKGMDILNKISPVILNGLNTPIKHLVHIGSKVFISAKFPVPKYETKIFASCIKLKKINKYMLKIYVCTN